MFSLPLNSSGGKQEEKPVILFLIQSRAHPSTVLRNMPNLCEGEAQDQHTNSIPMTTFPWGCRHVKLRVTEEAKTLNQHPSAHLSSSAAVACWSRAQLKAGSSAAFLQPTETS